VFRLGLKQEQQIAVFLRLVVVGKCTLGKFIGLVKVVGDFVALSLGQPGLGICNRLQDEPLPRPCGSARARQFSSRGIAHPSLAQSSSWTGTKSST
jgi:hypothetical protein